MANPQLVGLPPTYTTATRRVVTSGGTGGINLVYFNQVIPAKPDLVQPSGDANEFTVAHGATFTYTPVFKNEVTQGIFYKTYGPDCVTINPLTGVIKLNTNLMPLVQGYRATQSVYVGFGQRNVSGKSEVNLILHIGTKTVHRIGPTRTYTSHQSLVASGLVASGDTVIVDSGTYTGLSNRLCYTGSSLQMYPGGTAQKYTDIMARIPGEWVFDGQGTQSNAIYLSGTEASVDWNNDGILIGNSNRNWTQIQGIRTKNCTGSSIGATYCAYIIYRYCWPGDALYNVSTHNVSVTDFNRSRDCIGEYIHCMGYGRYLCSSYQSNNIVFRRCIGRFAPYYGTEPCISGVSFYRARRCYAMNCWVLDSQLSPVYTPNRGGNVYTTDAFQIASTGALAFSYDNHFLRCGAIKINTGFLHSAAAEVGANEWGYTANDFFGWDALMEDGGLSEHGIMTGYMSRLYNATIGKVRSATVNTTPSWIVGGREKRIYNSIFHDIDAGEPFYDHWANVGAECYEDNTSLGNFAGALRGPNAGAYPATLIQTNIKNYIGSIANGLQYPGRFEPGPILSDGTLGARNTMKAIGVLGTFYGDADFTAEVGMNIFPLPGSDLIQKCMNEYYFYNVASGMPAFFGNTGLGATGEEVEYWVNTSIRPSTFPILVEAQQYVEGTTKVEISWMPFPQSKTNSYLGFKIYRNGTQIGTTEFRVHRFVDETPTAPGTDVYTVVAMHVTDLDSGHSYPVTAKAV